MKSLHIVGAFRLTFAASNVAGFFLPPGSPPMPTEQTYTVEGQYSGRDKVGKHLKYSYALSVYTTQQGIKQSDVERIVRGLVDQFGGDFSLTIPD